MKSTVDNKITCPRCNGSGKTEFTHVVEGVCFCCKGFGMVYPKRITELSERAKKRKETIEAKYNTIKLENEKNRLNELEIYHEWQYKRNVAFFNKQIQTTNEFATKNINQLNQLQKLVLNENSTKQDVINFINDFGGNYINDYKYQLSKWTLDNYNFSYIEIPKHYDLETNNCLSHNYKLF